MNTRSAKKWFVALREGHASQHLLFKTGIDALGFVSTTALLTRLAAEQVAGVRGAAHYLTGTGHFKAFRD